jgi:transposase
MPYKRHRTVEQGAIEAAKLVELGATTREIANVMQVQISQASRYVRHARRVGLLPSRTPGLERAMDAIPRGSVRATAAKLAPEVQQWIVASIPAGVTLAQFAFACLVDQYFEEQGE